MSTLVAIPVDDLIQKQADKGQLYRTLLGMIEPVFFTELLKHTGGNQSEAARISGLNRATIRERIRRYGLTVEYPAPPSSGA